MTCFKPLRRKLGVVTLVMACVFVVGWIRCQSVADWLIYKNHQIVSGHNGITWTWDNISTPSVVKYASSEVQGALDIYRSSEWEKRGWRWKWRFAGFAFSEAEIIPTTGESTAPTLQGRCLIIPYWLTVIPLTALSAWMLLSKPQQPRSQPTQV